MFPLLYSQAARKLVPKFAVILRHLVRGGSFPAYWKLAVVGPVTKGSASSGVGDYRPISIAPALSKAYEKIVAGNLSHFLVNNCMLNPFQVSYGRGLGTCDALLALSHPLQVVLNRGMERRVVQLDF